MLFGKLARWGAPSFIRVHVSSMAMIVTWLQVRWASLYWMGLMCVQAIGNVRRRQRRRNATAGGIREILCVVTRKGITLLSVARRICVGLVGSTTILPRARGSWQPHRRPATAPAHPG